MPNPSTSLTAVTLIPRQPTTCPICGITYSSLHAMRTHVGKSHPEASKAKTKQSYASKSYRTDEYMAHSCNGKPECRHCGKQFASRRAFMGHFHQQACPVFFGSNATHRPISRSPLLLKGCSHRGANRLHCQKRAWPHIMPPSLRYPCNSSRKFRNSQN